MKELNMYTYLMPDAWARQMGDPDLYRRVVRERIAARATAQFLWRNYPRGPAHYHQGILQTLAYSPLFVGWFATLGIFQRMLGGFPGVYAFIFLLSAILLIAIWVKARINRLQCLLDREKRHAYLRFKRKYPRLAPLL